MKRLTSICVTLLLLLASTSSALAGHWSVTFNCSGQNEQDCKAFPPRVVTPWPATVDAPNGVVGFSPWIWADPGDYVRTAGTVTPVLHWNKDNGEDDVPPSSISVLVTTSSEATCYSYDDAVRTATTSLPGTSYDVHVPPDAFVTVGSKVIRLGVAPSTTTVALPAVALSSSTLEGAHPDSGEAIWASVVCRVGLVDMSISGTSTAGSSGVFPNCFSGTNCSIYGSASLPSDDGGPDGPRGITHAELLICGTMVNATNFLSPDYPTTVALSAVFDSTHFGHNTSIWTTFVIHDDHGETYSITKSAQSYNAAIELSNQTYGWYPGSDDSYASESAEAVDSAARRMNHLSIPSDSMTAENVYDAIPAYTVFYMNTHGSETRLSDCVSGLDAPTEHEIVNQIDVNGGGVYGAVRSKANQPPYNFVMLDGCNTLAHNSQGGLTDYFTKAFMGFDEASPLPFLEDRALLGWKVEMPPDGNNFEWTKRFWNNLATGNTVYWASVRATLDGVAHGGDSLLHHWDATEPGIVGDAQAKLHGVYVPGDAASSASDLTWYRPKALFY